jgi:hypothetical protein
MDTMLGVKKKLNPMDRMSHRSLLLSEKEEIIWRTTTSSEGIGKKLEDGDCVLPTSFP